MESTHAYNATIISTKQDILKTRPAKYFIIREHCLKMDKRFYNITKRKKIGESVMVDMTDLTEYDRGLFYLSKMVNELLISFYYSEKNISKLMAHEGHVIKKENQEMIFIKKVLNVYMDITLSKLIDKTSKTWSFYQLFSAIKKYNWTDETEIKDAIDIFATEIKEVQKRRHERHAHTSQKNKPKVIYTPAKVESYRNIIKKAVGLLDRFVDGEIPYILYFVETEEYNLRENLYSE